MNVMLTCAGRRNYLVRYFREALAGEGQVIAVDASMEAPAMAEADLAVRVPPVSEPDYTAVLLTVCEEYDIRLLVSLNDLELPVLAAQRQRFLDRGTIPVVSEPNVIDTCFDKWKTADFLLDNGLQGPGTFSSLTDVRAALRAGTLDFPLIAKFRWGTASLGIEVVEDLEELELCRTLLMRRVTRTSLAAVSAGDPEHCVLIQQKLQGQEYGLDVVNDLHGQYVTTFVKRKLAMRAGETDRAETVDHPGLADVGTRIGRALRHIGNLDCDVFLTPDGPRVLEMNPRFGGGYPFSHVAGANLPAALLAWAENRTPDTAWLQVEPGIRTAKCDRLVSVSRRTEILA
ncbi:MAG: ATP-grasp domain-containing protein [Thermoguttaceae bacterium]|jgi:carbamoyl-phosphate synthase large subunit|nr:ATP-grasp domain-containing protein [Thermoguttaceae bacterium]